MKTKLIAAIMGMAALASSASVTISDVIVRQQWPWNGKVNIDYILSDPDGGEHDINVIMRNGQDVVTNEFGSLSGDLFAVKSGSHRIVWDPAFRSPEYADAVLADFSVTLSTPEDSGQYMILDLSGGAEASIPVTFTNCPPAGGWNQDEYKTTKLVLRHIPAGTFRMGSPDDELGRSATREVMHNVTFTNDFYIGIFETTASQYSNMVHTAAEYSAGVSGSKLPAVRVLYSSLRGANDHNLAVYPAYEEGSFFDTFNKRFSFAGRFADYRFDLPTISQWEYACRAGTTGAWNDGTTITNVTTDAQLARIARYQANGYYNVGPVGAKNVPNAFGLYDMHGNASEMCMDRVYGAQGNPPFWTGDPLVEPFCRGDSWPWTAVIKGGDGWQNARVCRAADLEPLGSGGISAAATFRMVFVYRRVAGEL